MHLVSSANRSPVASPKTAQMIDVRSGPGPRTCHICVARVWAPPVEPESNQVHRGTLGPSHGCGVCVGDRKELEALLLHAVHQEQDRAVLGVSRGGPGTFVPGGPRDAPGRPRTTCPGGARDNLSRGGPGTTCPGVTGTASQGLPGASQRPPRLEDGKNRGSSRKTRFLSSGPG